VVAVRTRTGQISGCMCLRVGTEGPIDVCSPYADSERARRKFPPSSRCAQFVSGAGCRRPAPATEDRTGIDTCGAGAIPTPVYLSCTGTGYGPSVRTDRLSKHRVRAGLLAARVGTLTPSARE